MPEDKQLPPDILKRFVCRRCGNCCDLEGYVYVNADEQNRISEFLGMSISAFRREYAEQIPKHGWVLRDQPGSDRCVFLEPDRTCRIHGAKPDQCRSFPDEWVNEDTLDYCDGLKLAAIESKKDNGAGG